MFSLELPTQFADCPPAANPLMASFNSSSSFSLDAQVDQLLEQLPDLPYQKWISRSLATILALVAEGDKISRLDWKILSAALQDMQQGFEVFQPYRHVRKVTIFGSARLAADSPEYRMAFEFARKVTELGFMVMTGAGGGIMQAGNEGAGTHCSFGLNIQLPHEQSANPFIAENEKLINFKYFFTRKLFFLKESDAIALFPGGFGTLDEAFETLTLTQNGRFGPAPLVLIDPPGGHYWQDWQAYITKNLAQRGLISPDDSSLYTITDNVDEACQVIANFYQVYHSSRYVDEQFVLRLKCELSDATVAELNADFSDILLSGAITKSAALPAEQGDETEKLPRLVLHFNRRDFGRLYQLIHRINQFGPIASESVHPEQR